jgi:large subunit ribosomal protein L25
MKVETIPATRRELLGSKHTRRVRQRGQIPAIIYGHQEEPIPIAVDAHEVSMLLSHHSRVVTIDLENQKSQYLIKAVQYDHLDTAPIHLDLMRVDMDEKIELEVEVVLRGVPKGAHEGGVLLQMLNRVRVACIVTEIPEEIRHSVVELGLDEAVHVSDLRVPEGVTILNEPNELIAICREPAAQVEVAPVEGAEAVAAEPEVIGKKPEEPAAEE